MIHELIIHNIALIEELSISFEKGLNVISGETGSGKSILVNAISFILGSKTDIDLIRHGTNKASIQIIFQITERNPQIPQKLKSLGLEQTDEIILRRELYTNGRTRNFINSTAVTSTDLKSISELLLDISSQHSHQSLIQSKNHLEILDNFAQISKEKQIFKQHYTRYKLLTKQIQELHKEAQAKQTEREHLERHIEEIEAAALTPGEEEQLEETLETLTHHEALTEKSTQTYAELYQTDNSIITRTEKLLTKLTETEVLDTRLKSPKNDIQEALYLLENAKDFLRDYKENLEHSPETLEATQKRLNQIKQLKRRHGQNIEEILKKQKLYRAQIAKHKTQRAHEEQLKRDRDTLTKKIQELGNSLTKARQQKAKEFSKKIEEELKELAMQNTVFQIHFSSPYNSGEYITLTPYKKLFITEHGFERIEFVFSANPGEITKPLHKIASGGELSRFILAIKNIASHTDKIESLLFDEVDTGIGGEVLRRVGEKLKHIAKKRQVICITHSAQIAGQADQHYCIEKYTNQDRMKTRIKKLNAVESKEEIARMMSGNKVTETSLQHAQEIINKARETQESSPESSF